MAQVDVSRNPLPSSNGTIIEIQHRNLFVRVINHNKDYPLNVETLHFVPEKKTAIELQPFNAIYDNQPPQKFSVPPDRNETFIANGERLAEKLRAAGCEGEVTGMIELEEENGRKWYSNQLAVSTNELGRISPKS